MARQRGGKTGPKKGLKLLTPRKKAIIVSEENKIKLLNYVRDHQEALYGEWSNGRPKRSNIIAWKNVFDVAIR